MQILNNFFSFKLKFVILGAVWFGSCNFFGINKMNGEKEAPERLKESHLALFYCNGNLSCFSVYLQMLEQRLQSANQSLQATPNSTIHSLPPLTHPPLVDLWGAAQTEAYQADMVGFMGMPVAVDGNLTVPKEEVTTDHSPLLEAQEEEEIKVSEKINQ